MQRTGSMKYGKECICGRGDVCKGISAAFALMNDPRRGYVQVPEEIPNPTSQFFREMNGLRDAYLRHLSSDNAMLDLMGSSTSGRQEPAYIALHHFHPVVVETHAEKAELEAARKGRKSKGPKIPRTLKPVDLEFLQIEGLTDADRVRDEYGEPTELFYFVPNYPMDQVKEDLKKMIRVNRLMSEMRHSSGGSVASFSSQSTKELQLRQMYEEAEKEEVAVVRSPRDPSRRSKSASARTRQTFESPPTILQEPDDSFDRMIDEAEQEDDQSAAAAHTTSSPTPAVGTATVKEVPTRKPPVFTRSSRSLSTGRFRPWLSNENHQEDVEQVERAQRDSDDDLLSDGAAEDIVESMEQSNEPPLLKEVDIEPIKTPIDLKDDDDGEGGRLDSMAFGDTVVVPKAFPEFKDDDDDYSTPLKQMPPESAPIGSASATAAATAAAAAALGVPAKSIKRNSSKRKKKVVPRSKSFVKVTEEMRTEIYQHLLQFESQRRTSYANEMEKHANTWRSSLEVMQASIFEVARAERCILAGALANQAYADAMQAMSDDVYVDDEGQIVTNQIIRNRLKRARRKEFEANLESASSGKRRPLGSSQAGMLDNLVGATTDIAQKFQTSGTNVLDNVVEEISNLRTSLKTQMLGVKKRGDGLIIEMKRSEREVLNAWGKFYGGFKGGDGGIDLGVSMDMDDTIAPDLDTVEPTPANEANPRGTGNFAAEWARDGNAKLLQAANADFAKSRSRNPSPSPMLRARDFTSQPRSRDPSPIRAWFDRQRDSLSGSIHGRGGQDSLANSLHAGGRDSLSNSLHGGSSHGDSVARGSLGRQQSDMPSYGTGGAIGRGTLTRAQTETLQRRLTQEEHAATEGAPGAVGRLGESPVENALELIDIVDHDMWVYEMFYKSAVNYETLVWQRCTDEMEKLYETMQELEVDRLLKLQQVLLDFIPRQRRLYLSLTPIMQPVLGDLVKHRDYSEQIQSILDESIKKRNEENLKKDQGQRSKFMNRSRTSRFLMEQNEKGFPPLEGEMIDNGLLRETKIVERKIGVRNQWRTALCVVTADSCLHMLDLHLFPKFRLGSPANEAFTELLPSYTMPRIDDGGEGEARLSSLTKHLTPASSINLVKSTIKLDPVDPTVVELTETFKGRFRDEATRKIYLRLSGREETEVWMDVLDSYVRESLNGNEGGRSLASWVQ